MKKRNRIRQRGRKRDTALQARRKKSGDNMSPRQHFSRLGSFTSADMAMSKAGRAMGLMAAISSFFKRKAV